MLRSVVVGILLSSSLPATAADLPRIGIVGIHQASLDSADQERAVSRLTEVIEATGRFDALPPSEVATTLAGQEPLVVAEGLLATGRQQLLNGKRSYNQASPSDAILYLEEAITHLRAVIPGTNDITDLWEAWIYLGTSHLQCDPPNEGAARAAFTQASALAPTRSLDPALFAPNVIALFDAVQRERSASALSLSITTDLPANVWLDGIDRGPSPATVQGVLPGTHHVLARGEGKQGYVRLDLPIPEPFDPEDPPEPEALPALSPPRTVEVSMGPIRLGEGSSSAIGRSTEIAATYLSIGNRADRLEYLLILGISETVLDVQLLETASGTFSKPIELPYTEDADDEAAQAVPLLLNGIDSTGAFTATSPSSAPLDIGANSTLALLLSRQIAPTPIEGVHLEPDPPPRRKVAMVLGIVGGVVAAGAFGTGTFLLLN